MSSAVQTMVGGGGGTKGSGVRSGNVAVDGGGVVELSLENIYRLAVTFFHGKIYRECAGLCVRFGTH